MRVALTDGVEIVTAGDPRAYDERGKTEFVAAESFAGELPIRVTAAVPFAMVRADYGDLDASFTIVAALMSGAFLVLALQYVRRSNLPAFDLERAIEAGELEALLPAGDQPQDRGAARGCEVLCRWEKRNGEIGAALGAFIELCRDDRPRDPDDAEPDAAGTRNDLSELCRADAGDEGLDQPVRGAFPQRPASSRTCRRSSRVRDRAIRQLVFEITERKPLEKMAEANSGDRRAACAGLPARDG